MGQCYSVILKVNFTDKQKAADALNDKISWAAEERTNYNLGHYQELGIGSDTIEDLLKIFFGGWSGNLKTREDGSMDSDFDASYGWEGVMMDAFERIAPYLEDGSMIKIYPDCGVDKGTVVNGIVTWK